VIRRWNVHGADEEVGGLRDNLADRDSPCPGCGYSLRGLTGDTCPECGKGVADARKRFWQRFNDAERAFVCGAACSGLAIAAWVIAIVWSASDPLWVIALWVPGAMAVALLLLVLFWWAVLIHAGRKHSTIAIASAVVAWGVAVAYVMPLLLFLAVTAT
jgi:hypothetical protein